MEEKPPYVCSKCKEEVEKYHMVTEGGIVHSFCNTCMQKLENYNTVRDYCWDKKESWVDINMKEAKERRERGQGLWSL
jgi:predicted amidophosphoribosyltransferase